MKMKVIRCIIFFIILGVILSGLNMVFTQKGSLFGTINAYYQEPKNTVDVILFGASSVHRSWNPMVAWDKYGIASYNLSSGAQPLVVTPYIIEEALKYQSPKLIFVDLRGINTSPEKIGNQGIRSSLDVMRASLTRLKGVRAVLEYSENQEVQENYISYYLRLIKYHGRWDGELKNTDFVRHANKYKGFYNGENSCYKICEVDVTYSQGKEPLDEKKLQLLDDVMDYCATLDTKVVFTINFAARAEDYCNRMNFVEDYVKSRGFEILNYNSPEISSQVGYDYLRDFQDRSHLNVSGSIRHTNFLAQYMIDNYGIQDHRGDEKYRSWDEAYDIFVEDTDEKWNPAWTTIEKPE